MTIPGNVAAQIAAVLVAVIAFAGCSGDSASQSGTIVSGTASVQRGNAPALIGETFDGGVFDLSDHEGKPVVVNFWFPSCPPCRAELPDMQAAYEKYGPQGVTFVGVQQLGLDSAASGAAFWHDLGITFPGFADRGSEIQVDYEVLAYPTTIFLDRDHNIAKKWSGIIDADRLADNIEAILES